MNNAEHEKYISLLSYELVPATGCTEPGAIAYCAAKVRDLLGGIPETMSVGISPNILKNAKSVSVPSTGGLKGIEAAAAAGVIAGDSSKEMDVIANAPAAKVDEIHDYLGRTKIELFILDTESTLEIKITGCLNGESAVVHIVDKHSNIVYMQKNDEVLLDNLSAEKKCADEAIMPELTVREILDFAETVPMESIESIIKRQIDCNTAIAEEGLRNKWGAGIGSLLLESGQDDIEAEAKAYAAAGSDARMSGCDLPVIIISGSGNQGLTASLPVIRYAKHFNISKEMLYRALAVSTLVTLQQKSRIGRLSAYCGAVSAGAAAGAGIAYMLDGSYEAVSHTINNALAIISGTICDGAKPSCAAKIASAVEAGILGFKMYRNGKNFQDGEGVVMNLVDNTIDNIGIIASEGMRQTDETIISIMLQEEKVSC